MSMLPNEVSHGGTYAGNRIAAAAAVATLTILNETNALETICETGKALQRGVAEILSRHGIQHVFTGHPTMFGVMFADQIRTGYRGWAEIDHELYDAVAQGMIARGAMSEPVSREPWFVCGAHAAEDVARTCEIFEASLHEALQSGIQPST